MNAISQILSVFALLLAATAARAEEKIALTPSRIEFLETDICKMLKDGKMQKANAEEIVYFAFGRKIREDGDQDHGPKLVLAEKLGERGIIFRPGYVEVNFGVYYKKKASDKTAFYITGQAKLTIGTDFAIVPEVIDKTIKTEGSNLGSNLEIAANNVFGVVDIKKIVKDEIKNRCHGISSKLKRGIYLDAQYSTVIEPGKLVLIRKPFKWVDQPGRFIVQATGTAAYKLLDDDQEKGIWIPADVVNAGLPTEFRLINLPIPKFDAIQISPRTSPFVVHATGTGAYKLLDNHAKGIWIPADVVNAGLPTEFRLINLPIPKFDAIQISSLKVDKALRPTAGHPIDRR